MSVRVSLRRMLRLINVDTLCRVHNVGFLAGRLIYVTCNNFNQSNRLHTGMYTRMGNCVVVHNVGFLVERVIFYFVCTQPLLGS